MPNFLDHYVGPYPIHQLVTAQRTLIYGFNNRDSRIFDRLYKIMLKENCSLYAPQNKTPFSGGFRNSLIGLSQVEQKRTAEEDDDTSLSININDEAPKAKNTKLVKSETLQNTNLQTAHSRLMVCYKCDYCDFFSVDNVKIIQHLKEEAHKSCSKCKGVFMKKKITPNCIISEMAIKNEGKEFYSRVATCSKCLSVFPDIYTCSNHYKISHNEKFPPCYGLSDVIDFKKIPIPVDSICQKCGLQCQKQKNLNAHYGQFQHYPFDKPVSSDIHLMFTCSFCQKYFYAFLLAKAHILDHGLTHPSMPYTLNLIYYKVCEPKVTLLPLMEVNETVTQTKTKRKRIKIKVSKKKKKKSN